MPVYHSREEAGRRLAVKIAAYRDALDTIVIGLARGGVVVAQAVADELHLPLDIIAVRKIGAPFQPELAIGAVDDLGSVNVDRKLIKAHRVSDAYLARQITLEKREAERRMYLYRKGRSFLNLLKKRVILVDDGIATGFTMRAAIQSVKRRGAVAAIVAVPVASRESVTYLKKYADSIFSLYIPEYFDAVGRFYEQFPQVSDDEVLQIMQTYKNPAVPLNHKNHGRI